jgi:SAM-dependent methyltransferase
MINSITRYPRKLARQCFLTANTIRYVIEYRCILKLISNLPTRFDLLVDLGAGSGEMSARLIEAGLVKRGLAVEPDPQNFELLRQRYSGLLDCHCVRATIEKFSIPEGTVDATLSTQVLEHIRDDDGVVSRIRRMLKPQGYAIISVPHPPEHFPNPGHVRPGYTREELSSLFARHGFRLLDHDYFFTLPTLRRLIASEEFGWVGRLLPIKWADREAKLSTAEKAELQPYGLACLFQRN